MTRQLIAGGAGQVEQSTAQFDDDPRCRQLTLAVAGRDECDLTDPLSVSTASGCHRPQIVANVATFTPVDAAEVVQADGTHDATVSAERVALLAQHGRASNKRLLHLSTYYIFDGSKPASYLESNPASPLGPERSHRNVEDQVGCPTRAHGLAAALLDPAEETVTGRFHLTGGEQATWHDLTVAVFSHAGVSSDAEPAGTQDRPTPASRRQSATERRHHSERRCPRSGVDLPPFPASSTPSALERGYEP